MIDVKLQEYIDNQNKAYQFHSEKNMKSEINDMAKKLDYKIQNTIEQIKNSIQQSETDSKKYFDSFCNNFQSFIPSVENDFFIGSIVSISVICSEEEASHPYMNFAPKVNTILDNIYIYKNNDVQNQSFHWFFGKKVNNSCFEELPGTWKFRGICGGFKNDIVGVKYYLAQRVK